MIPDEQQEFNNEYAEWSRLMDELEHQRELEEEQQQSQ